MIDENYDNDKDLMLEAIGKALIDRIAKISKDNWLASWMDGIEYFLWWAIHEPECLENGVEWEGQDIEAAVVGKELKILKGLHGLIDAWCHDDEILSTRAWCEIYEKNIEHISKNWKISSLKTGNAFMALYKAEAEKENDEAKGSYGD